MSDTPPGRPSLAQLLDTVEGTLDTITETHSEAGSTTTTQVNYYVSTRISNVLEKARRIANHSALLNRLPLEILCQIATYLEKERDLINATAVCQRWRNTFLSFSRLWLNAGGSPSEVKAYIERSKSLPLNVDLSHPSLVDLIVLHTSRLAKLTVVLDKSSYTDQIFQHLSGPFPILDSFGISAAPLHRPALKLPPGPVFPQLKKLYINGISTFFGSQRFIHVTEFRWHTGGVQLVGMDDSLKTLEQFPLLERVWIEFHTDPKPFINPPIITLQHVQEMTISRFSTPSTPMRLPDILVYLRLPRLKTLCVQAFPYLCTNPSYPIFPTTTFGDQFPNLAEFPELEVDVGSGEATFRNTSQATLTYRTELFSNYVLTEKKAWDGLPLHSVRRLIANTPFQPISLYRRREWFIELLEDLTCLEHIELEGECDDAIRWLCDEIMQEKRFVHIKTLAIRCDERDTHRVLELKCLADGAGLATTVICIQDSEEESNEETDLEGSG